MIFGYILIITSVIFGSILLIHRFKSEKTLLQIWKELCSIDSVRFNEHLKKSKNNGFTFKKYIAKIGKQNFEKASLFSEIQGQKFRNFVRKKLHTKDISVETSSFIKKIKE